MEELSVAHIPQMMSLAPRMKKCFSNSASLSSKQTGHRQVFQSWGNSLRTIRYDNIDKIQIIITKKCLS